MRLFKICFLARVSSLRCSAICLFGLLFLLPSLSLAGTPRWYKDPKTGCQIWGSFPLPNPTLTWSGSCLDGKANGIGTLRWYEYNGKSGKHGKHVGQFKDGKANGQGTCTWSSGAKYVGQFKDDKIHGQGTLTSANGDRYIGQWKENKSHGQGTLIKKDGSKYIGQWKEGKGHGQGTLIKKDGSIYIGQWENSKQHGQGTLIWKDGQKYIGQWKEGKNHGQGTDIYANGNKYVGQYREDKRHGQGTFTWANGDKYVGQWKDNKRHGQGTFTWANGKKYVGKWKDGEILRHGTEILIGGNKNLYHWMGGSKESPVPNVFRCLHGIPDVNLGLDIEKARIKSEKPRKYRPKIIWRKEYQAEGQYNFQPYPGAQAKVSSEANGKFYRQITKLFLVSTKIATVLKLLRFLGKKTTLYDEYLAIKKRFLTSERLRQKNDNYKVQCKSTSTFAGTILFQCILSYRSVPICKALVTYNTREQKLTQILEVLAPARR